MNVHITMNGLQKGNVVLKKWADSTYVIVDSKYVDGNDKIILSDNIDSPEMYFLTIENTKKELSFFGDKGDIYIDAKLKSVNYKSNLKGSKNDSIYRVYKKNSRKFNDLKLDLIKAKFDNKNNSLKLDSIQLKLDNINKRQLRYSLNYVFNHGEYEVAPYIVLTDLNNLTIKYLDTLDNKFSDKVKNSKYGKSFTELVKERKGIN